MPDTVKMLSGVLLLVLTVLAPGCATPIGVTRVDRETAQRSLTSFVLSTGQLSGVKMLTPVPIAPGVASHSIIAVSGQGPREDDSDGVVKFSSAQLEGVESELIVQSGHSVQSNPEAIEEVRRILLLHASELCPAVRCPEPPAREPSTTRR